MKMKDGRFRYASFDVNAFDDMLKDLCAMNAKYIKQLLKDLKGGYISEFPGDYHRRLIAVLESHMFEEIVLK